MSKYCYRRRITMKYITLAVIIVIMLTTVYASKAFGYGNKNARMNNCHKKVKKYGAWIEKDEDEESHDHNC
ncbi:hypothetical protein ECANGB1_1758 [Enterospora canceri]|uniref:Uncharacterized protein n=1 Tax=Enterospora canceri TaxID=1081671 RepID=A0A1Y1S5H8_9MICR|nr:hypothetical protein ECANGB1_1758 [Enterospora canceri]